jgi:hypothetical protein
MPDALVSLDIGNGYVKGKGPGRASASFPSVLSVVNENMDGFKFPFSPENDFVIGYHGRNWAIGDTVHFQGLTPTTIAHRSRIQTEFYRVLFAASLAALVPQSATISAVVSLPPAAYWDKDAQKNSLAGEYELSFTGQNGEYRQNIYTVPIEHIRVIPEGVGAICTLVLDERGSERPDNRLASTTVGVVDIGTYTTDLIQLDNLRIVRSGCDTLTHALRDIQDRLRSFASSMGVDLEIHKVDEVLQQGYFLIGGRRQPIAEVQVPWVEELARSISGMIRTTWNGGNAVESILVTGGGAPLVEKLLAMEFPHVHLIGDVAPFFANSEGGYRYGLLREAADRRGR